MQLENIAVFPGTFDPITFGHQDLITRAASMFPKIIVAVAQSPKKKCMFSLEQRVEFVKYACQELGNVVVEGFDNLLVEFAKSQQASIILRGVRVVTDFDYELQLANMNRKMADNIDTVFLTPAEEFSFISSTLVKEVAVLGGDVSAFVSPKVQEAISGINHN